MKHFIAEMSEVVDAHVNVGTWGSAWAAPLSFFFFFPMKKEAKSSSESKDDGCWGEKLGREELGQQDSYDWQEQGSWWGC